VRRTLGQHSLDFPLFIFGVGWPTMISKLPGLPKLSFAAPLTVAGFVCGPTRGATWSAIRSTVSLPRDAFRGA